MPRALNFGPGPAILPVSVLEEAARAVTDFGGSGMSILEVSHRSLPYEEVQFSAEERMLRLLGLSSSDYCVLFLGGGASTQFAMAPANFLPEGGCAGYVNTGEWSRKAISEARLRGEVRVLASAEADGWSKLPTLPEDAAGLAYVHVTTNNTIEGTQWTRFPQWAGTSVIADMSSDILSRELDHSRFSMIYAGAQKNLGPAGVTAVILRRAWMSQARAGLSPMMAYATHAKARSLYNTPPVYAIYVLGLVLRWIEEEGGAVEMERRSRARAGAVYAALDGHPDVYEPTVTEPADRSQVNVTFRLRDESRTAAFLDGARERKMVGLKGHRLVGGFRASMYNAFPVSGADALARYLSDFALGRL